MMNSTLYSPEYIREMAMGGFERAIQGLKAHGGEVEELAEVVDAAFLLWQLAGEESGIAQQTIGEYLPVVVNFIHGSQMEG